MSGRLTVIVDNLCYRMGLCGEHGLAVMVEYEGGRLLMDTGQGAALGTNLWELFPGLDRLDALVVSHGHYDHTGGFGALIAFLGLDPEQPGTQDRIRTVCAHPDAENPKFSRRGGGYAQIGMSEPLETYFHTGSLLVTREPAELIPGVVFLGELPREYPAPTPPDKFFVEDETGDEFVPDKILDDTGVAVDTPEGLVLITGCNHSGLGNLSVHVRDLFPERKVRAVLGGLHLSHAEENRLDESAEALREMDAGMVFPMHCSGISGYEGLKERLGSDKIGLLGTGDGLNL